MNTRMKLIRKLWDLREARPEVLYVGEEFLQLPMVVLNILPLPTI